MNIKDQNSSLYYFILDCRDLIKKLPVSKLPEWMCDLILTPIESWNKKQIREVMHFAYSIRVAEVILLND